MHKFNDSSALNVMACAIFALCAWLSIGAARSENVVDSGEANSVERAMLAKDHKVGLALIEKYLATHPGSAEGFGCAARLANITNQPAKTVRYATQYFALKRPPIDPYLFDIRANGYLGLKQWGKASLDLSQAKKLNPGFGEVWILSAGANCGLKKYKEALEDYSRAIKLNVPLAYFQRADVEFEQGQISAAVADWSEYCRKTGEYKPVLARVHKLYSTGHSAESLQLIDSIMPLSDPKGQEVALGLRAHVLLKLGRLQDSLAVCDQIDKDGKHHIDSLRFNIYWGSRDCSNALPCLNRMVQASPKDRGLYRLRAECYFCLKQYAAALADFNRVPELLKDDLALLTSRADCNFMTGHTSEALRQYGEINQTDPSAQTMAHQGQCLLKLHQYKEAITFLNGAVKLSPLNAVYIAARGEAYRCSDKYPKAVLDFNDAITLDKKNMLYVYARGLSYLASNHPREAVQDFTTSSVQEQLKGDALRQRAIAYEQLGEKNKAEQDRAAAAVAACTTKTANEPLPGFYSTL